jgi:hypothetical protein
MSHAGSPNLRGGWSTRRLEIDRQFALNADEDLIA